MRRLDIPVFVGVMKSTENAEKPIYTVQDAPYTLSNSFEDYRWFRAEVAIRIQDQITETEVVSQVEEVTENVFEKIGRS